MMPFRAESISYADFTNTLSRYPTLISSLSKPPSSGQAYGLDTLSELDKYRSQVIPDELAKMDKKHLTKEQVELLTKWKLKHGKWRPRLANLVSSNSPSNIEDTTREAFALYSAKQGDPQPALNVLTRLSGIGPASASLLLSVYDPDNVPFFSDEAFRWVTWEEGKGEGWDRKISYNNKEYAVFVEAVRAVRERLEAESGGKSIAAGDVERVGWVIGREEEGAMGGEKKLKGGIKTSTSRKGGSKGGTIPPAPQNSETLATEPPEQPDTGKSQKRKPPTNTIVTSPTTGGEGSQELRRSKRVRNS
ncbi:MAG: hypothetical protein M1839_006111 [Geoglossum umbratile]|nr:MAG: hypothetical protein M1839_006111 [Geoglossum umbratile]